MNSADYAMIEFPEDNIILIGKCLLLAFLKIWLYESIDLDCFTVLSDQIKTTILQNVLHLLNIFTRNERIIPTMVTSNKNRKTINIVHNWRQSHSIYSIPLNIYCVISCEQPTHILKKRKRLGPLMLKQFLEIFRVILPWTAD